MKSRFLNGSDIVIELSQTHPLCNCELKSEIFFEDYKTKSIEATVKAYLVGSSNTLISFEFTENVVNHIQDSYRDHSYINYFKFFYKNLSENPNSLVWIESRLFSTNENIKVSTDEQKFLSPLGVENTEIFFSPEEEIYKVNVLLDNSSVYFAPNIFFPFKNAIK